MFRYVERERSTLQKHPSSPPFLVVFDQIFCVMFCRSLFVLFLLAIALSVFLRFTASDYPFGIFKLKTNIAILPTTQSSYRESMTRMTIEILIIEKRVRPGVPKGSAYPSLSTISVVCNISNMAKKAIFISYYKVKIATHVLKYVCFMVLNATSNNSSVISWRSV